MPLTPGTTLGPYEIQAPLGAGGMGEVYQARDTRLDRTVAIKVLPEHVAADPDLKQRFEREAKTISSLNHPHICTLYDVGQHEGTDFLVMEYLEATRWPSGWRRGAAAGSGAHGGHRDRGRAGQGAPPGHHASGSETGQHHADQGDLKPGNIMLTKAGAKLLDFCLAKLRRRGTVATEGFSTGATQGEPPTASFHSVVPIAPQLTPLRVARGDS